MSLGDASFEWPKPPKSVIIESDRAVKNGRKLAEKAAAIDETK